MTHSNVIYYCDHYLGISIQHVNDISIDLYIWLLKSCISIESCFFMKLIAKTTEIEVWCPSSFYKWLLDIRLL